MAMRAEVHIDTIVKAGATILQKAFCTQPFKVMDVSEDSGNGILKLMLISSSPGMLDEDFYTIDITVGTGSSLELLTQSYQRLYSMKKGAVQNFTANLQKNASLKYLPHPVVPHKSSDVISNNKIFLSAGCTLIWGEVITCGRKLNGEIFLFTRYHAVTEIFLDGRLVIKENLLMQPAITRFNGMGQMEGFTHQATLIFLHETVAINELTAIIITWLSEQRELVFGITRAPVNGIIVRLLGNKAEQLYDVLKTVATILTAKSSDYMTTTNLLTSFMPHDI